MRNWFSSEILTILNLKLRWTLIFIYKICRIFELQVHLSNECTENENWNIRSSRVQFFTLTGTLGIMLFLF